MGFAPTVQAHVSWDKTERSTVSLTLLCSNVSSLRFGEVPPCILHACPVCRRGGHETGGVVLNGMFYLAETQMVFVASQKAGSRASWP